MSIKRTIAAAALAVTAGTVSLPFGAAPASAGVSTCFFGIQRGVTVTVHNETESRLDYSDKPGTGIDPRESGTRSKATCNESVDYTVEMTTETPSGPATVKARSENPMVGWNSASYRIEGPGAAAISVDCEIGPNNFANAAFEVNQVPGPVSGDCTYTG